MILRRIPPRKVPTRRLDPVDAETLEATKPIVERVRRRGWSAVVEYAQRFGDVRAGEALILRRPDLLVCLDMLPARERALLERTADRIRAFAEAQRRALSDVTVAIPGGQAGHTVSPVECAGCYAPGGRFPLPSTVLMTATTAKVAGVQRVWVASPKPAPITLAAAAVAGADAVLAVGGAQAIAALAYGAGDVPPCDVVVGPGNRWVTAAKQLVSGKVRIDALAGPSELVVLADATADAERVAADLLAQAEHDPDALPVLVSLDERLLARVDAALGQQLAGLPTEGNARAALERGFSVYARTIEDAIRICDELAPEHLELCVRNADAIAPRLRHYGALFVGEGGAEVFGDYGAGPNHVLPTGTTARSTGGLSVLTFVRVRTWMRIDDLSGALSLIDDAAALARLEGLEAHARAAEQRYRVIR